MKPNYFLPFFALLLILSTSNANAAGSMLRVTCTGEDVGAAVTINGKFKGECPVDMEINEGAYKLRVEKNDEAYLRDYEQDIRIGDGVVKKVEVVLNKRLTAAAQQRESQRMDARNERVRIHNAAVAQYRIDKAAYDEKYRAWGEAWHQHSEDEDERCHKYANGFFGYSPSRWSSCVDTMSIYTVPEPVRPTAPPNFQE
jgi:hypothetical protein